MHNIENLRKKGVIITELSDEVRAQVHDPAEVLLGDGDLPLGDACGAVQDDRAEQVLLVAVLVVDGPRRDAALGREALDARAAEAVGGEDAHRAAQQILSLVLTHDPTLP